MTEEAQRDAFGMAICQALGIDLASLQAITLTVKAGKAPVLIAERLVLGDDKPQELKAILERYKLVPIEEEAQEVMSVSPGGLSDFMYSTTLLGIPLAELFGDERFADLLRVILRERQQNPDDWRILRRKEAKHGPIS